MRMPLLTAVFALLAACTTPETEPVQAESATADAAASGTTTANPGEAAVPHGGPLAAPSDVPETRAMKLALDGEGLRSFEVGNGSSRLIGFGTKHDEAMRMLEAMLAMPASERGENVDCGSSYATWPNGLTAWFARGEFAGWSVGSADSTMATASSLKVGSTREELEAAYDVRVAPSTLGTEFTAGGIAGLLDSANAGARVTALWAGATCIAR